MLTMYQPRLPKLSTSYVAICIVVPLIPRLQLVRLHLEYAEAAWDPYLAVIVNSWKRYSVGLLVLLNETTDQQHRCLLSFLNLAGKPSPIIGETVAYHSSTRCISTSPFRHSSKPTRSADGDTFCVLSSGTDPYKYSFYPPTIVD